MPSTSSLPTSETRLLKEEQRLMALDELGILDSPTSESFDRITRLASFFFGSPISAMSLTDRNRQWFKSFHGVEHREIPREGAPCAEVSETQEVLHLPDLLESEKYKECLLAKAGIRFYAGAPLTTRQGHTLGALCILDNKPRTLSQSQLKQLQDMAALVMAQVELQHDFGRIDPASGLPNRHQLEDDVLDLARAATGSARVLLLVELADLRHVNESMSVLGAAYVEELLRACARRIRGVLRKDIVLYHVGFAAFAIILDDTLDPWHELLDLISTSLSTPIAAGGGFVSVAVAYGVAPFHVDHTKPTDVLQMARGAVHEARHNDVRFAVYNESSHAAHQRRFSILKLIHESLSQEDHLQLVYQPRVDAQSGRCVGAEALLRWSHPELGSVSPGEFVPLIEQTSLAGPMTRWVLTNAFSQIRRWKAYGLKLKISINLSARNLEEPHFAEQVANAMDLFGVDSDAIELEFTESAIIRHENRVLGQLRELRNLGVSLAIDDFGTGYSSFSYLQKLPAQVVKLDQSFIRNITQDEKGPVLVKAMIGMSHDLGYRVVAEGVEAEEELAFLREIGCDEIQGFIIARPLAAHDFEDFLRSHQMYPAPQLSRPYNRVSKLPQLSGQMTHAKNNVAMTLIKRSA